MWYTPEPMSGRHYLLPGAPPLWGFHQAQMLASVKYRSGKIKLINTFPWCLGVQVLVKKKRKITSNMKHLSAFSNWTFEGKLFMYQYRHVRIRNLNCINESITKRSMTLGVLFHQHHAHLMIPFSGLRDPVDRLQWSLEQCWGLICPVCKPLSVAFEWQWQKKRLTNV